ncbi:phosphoadenosine phosphosulfate reductase family protein [Candidatus Peregrinibacteria bacterium]|jgi:3'-phosphoadenosine 5'-phosphosulfate sulfotransferase (PAPS reductase)/FAD synthetase|nr:phosphoadenosine phosphosulfate reductase family protein [Candidatus Peregrinibacteria bacterium]
MIHTSEELMLRQKYPLDLKIEMSVLRIMEWYKEHHGEVYVAFSGGKDSTVLLDLVRSVYPEVPAVFSDTGLEYPEIRKFVKTIPNVTWIKPKMQFPEVIKKYGFPVVSKEQSQYIQECQKATKTNFFTRRKRLTGINSQGIQTKSGMISKKWKYLIHAPFKISHKCCDALKKRPFHKYEKTTRRKAFIGTMATDSMLRKQSFIRFGCNMTNKKHSRPMMFWTEKDVWEYIKIKGLSYSEIYDMGESRTGCMFCAFGITREKGENKFQRMKKTHPKIWNYCINKLGLKEVLDYINVDYN